MKALVTGFEPFGGENINASLEAVRQLPARVAMLEVTTAKLPTSYARALSVLESAIARTRPNIVLCVGEAAERRALSVERIAVNLQDARIPDNDGSQPSDVPVVAGGPVAYVATLPVKAAVAALQAAGLAAEVSNSAGTFVCNHVFYGLMHFAATREHRFCGGFLHVPCLARQTEESAPPMSLGDIVRGIHIVLETAGKSVRADDF